MTEIDACVKSTCSQGEVELTVDLIIHLNGTCKQTILLKIILIQTSVIYILQLLLLYSALFVKLIMLSSATVYNFMVFFTGPHIK